MSFPRSQQSGQRHPAQAPGFGAVPDPFAGISQGRGDDDDDAYAQASNPIPFTAILIACCSSIDFEDTYDGLGDQLSEADDDLNDDTFGGGDVASKPPAKDFDFSGNTGKVSSAIMEEAVRYNRYPQPPTRPTASSGPLRQSSKPYKTGYEAYKNPGYVPDLQVDQSLWATAPKQQDEPRPRATAYQPLGGPQKKMMSLEEVEAAMRAQPKKTTPQPPAQQQQQQRPPTQMQTYQAQPNETQHAQPTPVHILQHPQYRPSQQQGHPFTPATMQSRPVSHSARQSQTVLNSSQAEMPARPSPASQAPQVDSAAHYRPPVGPQPSDDPHQPRHILQNPNRHSAQLNQMHTDRATSAQSQHRVKNGSQSGGAVALPIITHPSQLANLSEEQREYIIAEDAKRAKRNHKIYQLSKGNGLMTPQDKNFITRIQLQQLMTATGNVDEQNPDISLAEDFYYQVYNQIENRPRQHPHQPLSNFAQTYLFQTGGRQGGMNRRHNRGENHMHRMQQQVQRAVEAAKAKPKNKQLVMEGSLGKISFSNAKTPKPLLNIKRNDKLPQSVLSTTDRKAILKNIEAVYASLMKIEDHDRRIPQQPLEQQDAASVEAFAEWRQFFKNLNQRLWSDLKVMEPIMPESTVLHPFIALLSYPKGKKAIPRIFTHIDQEQRLTILTIIMIQLDSLDVIRSAQPQFKALQSASIAREQVDLFLQTVMPSLFSYVTEAPLSIIVGLIGLVVDRIDVALVARSQVGLEILTMLLSQAEIIRKSEASNDQEWEQWLGVYRRLFDIVEPTLAEIFPASVNHGNDVYVWQFLATMGTGANPEQQQRLVLAVKFVSSLPNDIRAEANPRSSGIESWTLYIRARLCRQRRPRRGAETSTSSCKPLASMWTCWMAELQRAASKQARSVSFQPPSLPRLSVRY